MKRNGTFSGRFIGLSELKGILDSRYRKEHKLVFTNGCFDILHAGHIHYLSEAANLGDILIIGLNSDTSVNRLKGPGRPVNPQDARATMLTALRMVDFVVLS